MDKKCLIIDDLHESIIPMLEGSGFEVNYHPKIKRAEILRIIHEYDGLLVRSKTYINDEILDAGKKLKFIGRAGAGIDQIDINEVEKRGIALVNAPEGNRDAVAEHVVGAILNLLNNITLSNEQVRSYVWDREGNRGHELGPMTVAIIGYGYMGKATARRLAAFGCTLLAYDKFKTNYGDEYARQARLEEVYEQADLVSLHFPLTAVSRGSIDLAFFRSFRKPIWFVNSARGELVSFETINSAFEEGLLRGAVLDVIENERFDTYSERQRKEFEFLVQNKSVLFTPHVAGWTFESHVRINEVLHSKIKGLGL